MKRLPRISKTGDFSAAWNQQIAPVLDENFQEARLQPGIGCRVSSSPSGQSIIVDGNYPNLKTKLPFEIILSVSDAGDDQVQLSPGICGGLLPTNLNTPVTIDLSSTVYVFLDVVSSQGQITSVTINANNSPFSGQTPNAGYPPSSFTIPVGIIMVDSNGNATQTYNLLAKNWVSPVGSVAFSVGLTNYYVWTW